MSVSLVGRIARREVRALFDSPAGYLVIGTFWLVAGMLLVSLLFQYREALLNLAQSGRLQGGQVGIHVNPAVMQPRLVNLGWILALLVPLLTMRSFAEERRSGSLELLLGQPVRGFEVVAGKLAGAWLALLVCLSILIPHAVVLAIVTTPDWSAAAAGVLGLLLLGTLFCAVGILLSALSRSQVEAAVLSLGTLLAVAIGPAAMRPSSDAGAAVVAFVSVMERYADFARGTLDLGHVAFFLGAILLLSAAALRGLDLVRWQG